MQTRMWKVLTLLLLLLLLTVLSFNVLAGIMTISDSRLDDLTITPNIGRGYSPSTNTFQSQCFSNIATTKSSADFEYQYEEINDSWFIKYNFSINREDQVVKQFVESKYQTYQKLEGRNSKSKTWILAKIQLKKYYSAINEQGSGLSPAAKELLTAGSKQDVIGFFAACGPYYVRSLTRVSSFYALLRFETTEGQDASEFRLRLERKMHGFQGSETVGEDSDGTFNRDASSKYLRVFISGIGLNPELLNGLLAVDIQTFRASINNALKAMQASDVGRVISMELAPWTEEIDFQNSLGAVVTSNRYGDIVEPWLAKVYQEQNADFIAQVMRVRRYYLANIYTSKSCRSELLYNWITDGDLNKLEKIYFIKLNDKESVEAQRNGLFFYKELDRTITLLQGAHDKIIELSIRCFSVIQKNEKFSAFPYYQDENCQELDRKLYSPINLNILNYCMPQIAKSNEVQPK
ncbi:MAG: hypothetical protein HQK51_19275 [Oligoflexia bacterium]|nr:hypothetical protein [Oligoflexia bacterium]